MLERYRLSQIAGPVKRFYVLFEQFQSSVLQFLYFLPFRLKIHDSRHMPTDHPRSIIAAHLTQCPQIYFRSSIVHQLPPFGIFLMFQLNLSNVKAIISGCELIFAAGKCFLDKWLIFLLQSFIILWKLVLC